MKSVLVLLSTYNGEKYLHELLDSLVIQKSVNLSILARDDESKDTTVQILEKYKSKCDIQIIEGKNVGAANSFFELIRYASLQYDYYAFCDQDDIWLENKLMKAVTALEAPKNSQYKLYYSGQKVTDEKLNILYNHKLVTTRSYRANFVFNQAAGCTMLFNRQMMQKLKQYQPANVFGHDVWCYKLCVSLGGEVCIESDGYILYRQHGNNVVGLQNGAREKLKRAYNYIYKYNCSSYSYELLRGYGDDIDIDWKSFIELICTAKKKIKSRLKLINTKGINFDSKSLRIIFIIKVLVGQI